MAVSGLEITQDSLHLCWSRDEVDARLQAIMAAIHRNVRDIAEEYGAPGNYVKGANIAGFLKVARAMHRQGLF